MEIVDAMGRRKQGCNVKKSGWEFPGGPVVRTPCFHCRGPGFDPWSGNEDPTSCAAGQKKKKKEWSQ